MSMSDWAKREVEIACKREAPDRKDGEWDYGCACYESALKAYLCLMEDGHSGFSFGMTRQILNRLMEGKPLTPIDDVPENWNYIHEDSEDGSKKYQCRRMSSLFKYIYPDGHVRYSDCERYYCIDVDAPHISYSGGGASDILDDSFPITFPYNPPSGKYKITTREYLTDRANGDFDTKAFLQITTPDGQIVEVNRYFGEVDGKWTELTKEQFDIRVELHIKREYMEIYADEIAEVGEETFLNALKEKNENSQDKEESDT